MSLDDMPAYIGVWPCGCVTAATVARPGREKDTAKFVAEMVKDGMTVVSTTTSEAKSRPHFLVTECPHSPKGWDDGTAAVDENPAQGSLLDAAA